MYYKNFIKKNLDYKNYSFIFYADVFSKAKIPLGSKNSLSTEKKEKKKRKTASLNDEHGFVCLFGFTGISTTEGRLFNAKSCLYIYIKYT